MDRYDMTGAHGCSGVRQVRPADLPEDRAKDSAGEREHDVQVCPQP
jgi:hypothetical protein